MIPIVDTIMSIAGYQVKSIPTGIFGLDGGAMFGTVPKVLWEKWIPSDDKNRIPMEARALLLKGETANILIDTGNGSDFVEKYGEKLGSKFSSLYNITPSSVSLESSLKKEGLGFEDITHVILTHLHFDHAGGATRYDSSSKKIVPTFKNAKYFVQKANLETALNPNQRERASYLKPNFEPLLESGVLNLVDGNIDNLLPNIHLRLSHGHTYAQQNVVASDKTSGLFYGADLIPTHAHVKIPWIMGYDLNPLVLMQEKQVALNELAQKKWALFLEHDPYMDACYLQADERGDFIATQGLRFH